MKNKADIISKILTTFLPSSKEIASKTALSIKLKIVMNKETKINKLNLFLKSKTVPGQSMINAGINIPMNINLRKK